MTERLRDFTAHEYALQQRQACLVLALLKDNMGVVARDDDMLDHFCASRKIPAPVRLAVKAAVTAMDSTSGLAPTVPMLNAFLGAVLRATVLGQLGAVKVPVSNAVGALQTANASAHWIGEQAAKPLSALGFATVALPARKCAADVAVTSELLRMGNADTLALLEKAVVSAVAAAIDEALLDPANAGTVNVKPASLTNGLTAVTPAGDFQNQVGQVFAAISDGAPTKPVLVVSLQSALRLTGLRDLTDAGITVVTSPAAENHLIAIDADGVAYADDGGELRIGSPDVEMVDTPTTPSTAATVMTSTFQRNMKVIRAERWVNWAKRADAVAYLTLV